MNLNKVIYFCAFNFPAILQCYTDEYWDDLKDLYIKMSRDKETKVRKSIACSLADVSEILGSKVTEKDLLPIFEGFFKDECIIYLFLAEIKLAVFKNLPRFLKNLKMETRYKNLDKIKKMIVNKS